MSFYFTRTGADSYRATQHVAGAWNPDEQHISPVIGLLAHLLETDQATRRAAKGLAPMQLGRLSADIYGVVPVDEFSYAIEVLRPGRSIELVQATLTYRGRTIVLMRVWFMQAANTTAIAATPLTPIPGPMETPEWDMRTVWPGGYIESVQTRRQQVEPGHARTWMRTAVDLADDATASPLARAIALFDTANGTTVRHDPRQVAFPNVEITASLFRMPFVTGFGTDADDVADVTGGPEDSALAPPATMAGEAAAGSATAPGTAATGAATTGTAAGDSTTEWLGINTRVSFGPSGLGLTASTLHDEQGPFGTLNQTLTVRPVD